MFPEVPKTRNNVGDCVSREVSKTSMRMRSRMRRRIKGNYEDENEEGEDQEDKEDEEFCSP